MILSFLNSLLYTVIINNDQQIKLNNHKYKEHKTDFPRLRPVIKAGGERLLTE